MAYSVKINKLAEEALQNRRMKALHIQEITRKEIFKELPRLEEIERQLAVVGAETAKTILRGKNTQEAMLSLAKKSLALQQEMNTILFQNGYSKDALEPKYVCKKCKDTGKVDNEEGKTVVCECLKKLRSEIACKELNDNSPLSLSSFESFTLDKYSMDISQGYTVSPYERMKRIFMYCQKYANNFMKHSDSLFLRGATGLGKTHLSLAIANEVLKSGFGVVYVSAPDIIGKMEHNHFSYNYKGEEEILESLTNCDLLIFDDLGTELQSNYATTSIYNIINTRLLKNKPTIISTNLTLKELEQAYTQRFVSRIVGNFVKMDFLGTDNRGIKGA